MEKPEVKWKQFLFVPGGSRVEAKSCSCQWLACSSAFMFLPFYPPIVFLPGRKIAPRRWVAHLEITQDGLWAHAHRFVLHSIVGWEGTTVCGQIMPLIVPQQDAATTPLLTVELLATLCTCALSISPSGFWFSVIVHQRFLKMIVMPPSPAKSDYKPCFQRVTQKLAVLPAPLPLTVSTCTAWTIYLSSMLTASP